MLKAFKYRIYPTKSQLGKLENTFSICRTLYNNALEHRKLSYQRNGRFVSYEEQQNGLPEIKEAFPWFKSVYSLVLQDALHRVDKAFKNFYRRYQDAHVKEKGFPRFKGRGQYTSITYSQYKKYPGNLIKVPKIGEVKIIYHINIPADGNIKTLTISKEADKWFACFSVEVEDLVNLSTESKTETSKAVGIDMGLIDFFYTSDNENVSAPRLLRLAENNLKRLQRKLSSLKKNSKEYLRVLKALKKAHFRVKEKRKGFIMEKASQLVKDYDVIAHEKLSIKNLVRRPKPKTDETGKFIPNGASTRAGLNKSINDAGWGLFFDTLQWLSKKAGKVVVAVNPAYTSQQCSNCGNMVKKSLSTRTHLCECGFVANRDHNAAINILRLGLQSLGVNP
jgi:putative transposase